MIDEEKPLSPPPSRAVLFLKDVQARLDRMDVEVANLRTLAAHHLKQRETALKAVEALLENLKRPAPARAPAARPAPVKRPKGSLKRILVCDDDDTIVELLTAILEEAGYEVTGAEHGKEGIDKFREENPDMMIVDIDMPHKDGFEVMEELTRDGSLNKIPFFVVSAHERKEDLKRAEGYGAKQFLTKPFEADTLVKLVQEALPK